MSTAAIAAGALLLMLIVVGAVLLAYLNQEEQLTLRISEVQRRVNLQPDVSVAAAEGGLLQPVAALGAFIARSGLLSLRTLTELQQTLHTAGLRGRTGLSLFVGTKLVFLVGLPLIMFLVLSQLGSWPVYWPALVGGAGIVGLLGPDMVVRGKRKTYLKALDQGLPDALDMLVICGEAGLGLEASFERVSNEIVYGHPVMAEEMQITLREMRINADRRAALIGLGQRTGLESLRRLGGTLVQTMQYGTPLGQALRMLSVEMRTELLVRFEEKAARLPVLLTMPMILFILPCVFLIVGGPAAVQLFSK